jgi:hypothetical protein
MSKRTPDTAEVAKVETELWNVVRALNAIEEMAAQAASASGGQVNAFAEAIAGIAAVTVSHVRRQQIALGGEK